MFKINEQESRAVKAKALNDDGDSGVTVCGCGCFWVGTEAELQRVSNAENLKKKVEPPPKPPVKP